METTRKAVLSPEDHIVRPELAEHRTFYREGGVCVTDRWLTISGRRFAVADLRNLRTVRGPSSGRSGMPTAVACVVAVVTAAVVASSGEPALMIGGPVVAALPVGLAFVAWRVRQRFFALYAEYGTETVQVLGTSDERRFNQICRALVRAREYGRDHAY